MSLQAVPKNIGKKTKWVKSGKENDNVLNQFLSEGHQTLQTKLSTLSDIEEEPVQPELTPSCSYSNEGLERRNTLTTTPFCVDQRRANLDDLDDPVSDQTTDSATMKQITIWMSIPKAANRKKKTLMKKIDPGNPTKKTLMKWNPCRERKQSLQRQR